MFKLIGAGIGQCAQILGCEHTPDVVFKQSPQWHNLWHTSVYYESNERKLLAIDPLVTFSQKLATATREVLESNHQFITIGGDHSCAIGTWSAVADYCGEFGLIWIDAHMDAHTPQTSLTHNLHGMPVAVLLGQGDARLVGLLGKQSKVKPENIVLIGIRSYEPAEKELLQRLGVKVFEMPDVERLGFDACMRYAIDDFTRRQLRYGISFDLDGLDPTEIVSLGTPEPHGLCLDDVLTRFAQLNLKQLIGVEITEYNPVLDDATYRDLSVIQKVVTCFIEQKQ